MGEINHFLFNADLPVIVNGFSFESVLGHGGFSEVYLVKDVQTRLNFAAKVTFCDKSDTATPEIRSLSRLSHPNIIQIYKYFYERRFLIQILDYCPFGSIEDEITLQGPMSRPRFLFIATQVIRALSCCHRGNIAHRDIKPGNLLIDSSGRIKLADFGLSVTATGLEESHCGSSHYQPPEMFLKTPYNPFFADIWSLGVTFAFMLNGTSPWRCDNYGALKRLICEGRYHLRQTIDPDISKLISKMIVIAPNDRIELRELVECDLFNLELPPARSSSATRAFPLSCIPNAKRTTATRFQSIAGIHRGYTTTGAKNRRASGKFHDTFNDDFTCPTMY